MGTGNNLTGECFYGAVKFEVSGEPVAMGYCHCTSCRHWSAGPVNAFSLWKPDALKVTTGLWNHNTKGISNAPNGDWQCLHSTNSVIPF